MIPRKKKKKKTLSPPWQPGHQVTLRKLGSAGRNHVAVVHLSALAGGLGAWGSHAGAIHQKMVDTQFFLALLMRTSREMWGALAEHQPWVAFSPLANPPCFSDINWTYVYFGGSP